MSKDVNLELDGQFQKYGEAMPMLDMPLSQQGGDHKKTNNDDSEFDTMFGGYLSDVAKKIKTKPQNGGGGGVGFSVMPENYIAGQSEIRSYGSNYDPILQPNGSLTFPKCGDQLCAGSSGQTGGSLKKSKKTSKSKRCCICHKIICTCRKNKKSKKSKKSKNRKNNMKGGTQEFRSSKNIEQPYPFNGNSSILKLDGKLQDRDFTCNQPNWNPNCI